MLCILYVVTLSACLGLAALAVERAAPDTWPRRWLWCAVIALSILIPPIYQAGHKSIIAIANDQGGWFGQFRSIEPAVMRLWLIASVLLFLWGIFDVVRVSRIVRRTQLAHTGVTMDGVSVLVADSWGPATVGVWHSNVLIPRWVMALPPALRQYIIYHEEQHRRAHDVRMLFFASLAVIVTPWNVALWWHLRRLSLAVELDCDNRVVRALGNPAAYAELLLKVAEASNRGPRLQPGFIGGRDTLERRLTHLIAPSRVSRLQRVLLPAIAIVLLMLALLTPHPVRGTHTAAKTTHAAHR